MSSSSSASSLSRSGYVKVTRSSSSAKKMGDIPNSTSSVSQVETDPSSIPLTSVQGNGVSPNSSTSLTNNDILNPVQRSHSTNNVQDAQQPQPASWARIYSLCIANFGINCAWALEFAITTPYFEQGLNSGKVISHAVWIVGPMSGLIVAPIVGTLSDRCRSKFGRRRPFILWGMIATLVGMAMFSNATPISRFLTNDNENVAHVVSIVIAVLAFCILDLAINTTMWPVRALQGDLIPNNQQHSIQSASIVMFSLGDAASSFLLGLFPEPVSNIQLCFLIVALIYSTSVASLLILGKETPLRVALEDGEEGEQITQEDEEIEEELKESASGPSFNIFAYLRSLPGWMWRIGITHSFGYFALFCFLPNVSSWLGSTVLGGDPYAPAGSEQALLYEKGVTVYGESSVPRNLIQIIYSAVYPYLLRYVAPSQLMGVSFFFSGILLFVLSGTKVLALGRLVVMAMALPIAAHFTLPVGLTVENSEPSNRGRYLGALNCFAVVPQLIDTSYTGFVSRYFGEATVMRIGGVWAMICGICAFLYMKVY